MDQKIDRKMLQNLKSHLHALGVALEVEPAKIFQRLSRLATFKKELEMFRAQCDWPIDLEPKLGDIYDHAGSLGEYFWQDLWIAKKIFRLNPERHIDVGSRIDGFVAHIACMRKIEVFDLRPLPIQIPNVSFHQIDVLNLPSKYQESTDCVTCLHSIEHFGLGRYGDEINPSAWKQGFENLSKMLKIGGKLILSTPIGYERVKFNAHRVFHPLTIAEHGKSLNLSLEAFEWCHMQKNGSWCIVESQNIQDDLRLIGNQKYSLGIFVFAKTH